MRKTCRPALKCAAIGTDFSSVAAWETEYAQIKKSKELKPSAVEVGGDILSKTLPGLSVIGTAFERAFNKDTDQQKMVDDSVLAKQGEKQLNPPPMDGYRIVNTFKHTKESFCQGISWCPKEKIMFEGSGGFSGGHGTRIAKIDLETGKTLMYRELPDRYFGEGIVIIGERLYQLTWTSKVGFVYDKTSLKLIDQFSYDHQGWGATTDGEGIIISDGSPYLYFYNPDTFELQKKLLVKYLGRKSGEMTPLRRLNDLQYINGKIWANIWETDRVAVINPSSGFVERFVELNGLLDTADEWIEKWNKSDRCLNGIAYDQAEQRLFVTGKMWTKLYEIQVLEGEVDRQEEAKKTLPKDYYNPAAGGAFDPLGMGIQ